ncbi:hypothetical protein CDV55_103412 [Aspergillus turcosus]|nr:hypothetical protein CDV55_103412 [Aspergillus turcosus]
MNPLTYLKLIALRISSYVWRWQYRTSTTGQEKDQVVQAWLGVISSQDPEATEPALGVYPWFSSNPETYTDDTFKSQLRVQRCWDYYADQERSRPQPPPERYDLGPKLSSQLDKLDKSRLSERKPEKYTRERCRIILLPYLEAAVARYEKDRTVAGKYELLCSGSTKVKDMVWPPEMKIRRLIADSNHTITFTNAEGQQRDLLAVVVAKKRNGDAYNPLLAYMALYLYARHGSSSSTHSATAYCADCMHYAMSVDAKIRHAEQGGAASVRGNKQFFRYALDVTCRGGLFVDKRCLDFRRGFLGDVGRYMIAVGEPYEACRGIGACR